MPELSQLTQTAVPALDKAMLVVDFLLEHSPASFTTLQQELMLPKSTLSRLLSAMISHGLLRQVGDKYALGLKFYRIGQRAYADYNLAEAAEPFLRELRDKTGLTCHLGILEGTQPVYLSKLESPYMVIVRSYVGKQLPVHSTALGKVLLAFSPDATTERIIKLSQPFERFTSNTLTSVEAYQQELSRVREQGYACDREEDTVDVICYAVPIFSADHTVAAAISVTGVKAQYSELPFLELLDLLQHCAADISKTLG